MKSTLAAFLICTTCAASAGEVYTAAGLPGLMLGYSTGLSQDFAVRADVSTVGTLHRDRNIQAIDYQATIKADRLALLGDWFPAGGFRLTGGLTINHARGDLQGHGNGGMILVGNTSYPAGPDDRFVAKVTYPTAMPYIGLGYGHAPRSGPGWGFLFDVGLSIGRPTVTGSASGPLLSQSVSQQDVQAEVNRVRDNLDKYHGIPQLSLGASYRF